MASKEAIVADLVTERESNDPAQSQLDSSFALDSLKTCHFP